MKSGQRLTLVVDCGRYSAKVARISAKSNVSIKETPNRACQCYPPGDGAAVPVVRDASSIPALLCEHLESEIGEGDATTLLLLLDTLAPKHHRECLLQYCFETVGVEKLYLGFSAATSLFSAAITSGVCVDVGYGGVRLTPLLNGVPLVKRAVELPSVGSAHVDARLDERFPALLAASDNDNRASPLFHTFKAQCGVFDASCCSPSSPLPDEEQSFTLPDGSLLTFNRSDVSRCYQSLLVSPQCSVVDSFRHLHAEVLADSPSEWSTCNWVVAGGGANTAGLQDYLKLQLTSTPVGDASVYNGLTAEVRPVPLQSPSTAAVEGGIALSHLSSFRGMCTTREDYADQGPERCLHNKIVDAR